MQSQQCQYIVFTSATTIGEAGCGHNNVFDSGRESYVGHEIVFGFYPCSEGFSLGIHSMHLKSEGHFLSRKTVKSRSPSLNKVKSIYFLLFYLTVVLDVSGAVKTTPGGNYVRPPRVQEAGGAVDGKTGFHPPPGRKEAAMDRKDEGKKDYDDT